MTKHKRIQLPVLDRKRVKQVRYLAPNRRWYYIKDDKFDRTAAAFIVVHQDESATAYVPNCKCKNAALCIVTRVRGATERILSINYI